MGTGVPPFCTQLAFPTVDAACEWAMEELDKHDAELVYLQVAGEGERVLDRTDQIVDLALELLHEGGGDPVRAGGHLDRVGPDVQAAWLGFVHPAVDLEKGDPLAVDRDLNLLGAPGASEDLTFDRVVGHDVEDVLAVGREVVDHGEAAARAEGSTFDLILLTRDAGHPVDRVADFGLRVTQREACDLPSGAEVPFDHRRRRHLHVRDVVEVVRLGVERQIRRDIDIDTEQVLDSRRVLGLSLMAALNAPIEDTRFGLFRM